MNMQRRSPLQATVLVMSAAVLAAALLADEAAEPVQRVVVVGKRLPPPAVEPQGVQRVEVIGRRALSTAKASDALAARVN